MRRKKLICILDTETTINKELVDLGFIIADTNGNIVLKRQYIVPKNFQRIYYKEKAPIYYKRANKYKYEYECYITTETQAIKLFKECLDLYNVKEIYAYNMLFDFNVLNKVIINNNMECNPFENRKIQCLWGWAAETICSLKKYHDFVKVNNFTTEKGFYSTSAETVYRFILGEPDFNELHVSVDDCEIEYQIYLECKRRKTAKIKALRNDFWLLSQPYEIVQNAHKGIITKWNKLQKLVLGEN